MKLLKHEGQSLVFELADRERELFVHSLRCYPQLNPDYFPVSRSAKDRQTTEQQRLLRDALAERQAENRKLIETFITERLSSLPLEGDEATGNNARLTLPAAQADWLLEVLNDVRVGNWVKLGRPRQHQTRAIERSMKNLGALGVMEFCGYLQSAVLEALAGAH